MEEIRALLNQRWVLKKNDPDLYFKVKDKLKTYQEFFKDKLGYAMIINPIMIKLEKLPGKTQTWMGIEAFDTPLHYVFLCWILMFLEDKEPEEQFVLSQVIDYINAQPSDEGTIDWTVYQNRRVLIKVLEFFKTEGMMLLSDGDDSGFTHSEASVEVLYENTGASKYFVRRFPFDMTQAKHAKDFETMDWQNEEGDRGIVRRHRVYRRLVMEPVVYQNGSDDQDYLYIKNIRSTLAHDFDKYLGVELHVHKNGAMLLFPDLNGLKNSLPNRKNISDIVLQTCNEIRHNVESGRFVRNLNDSIVISGVKWQMFIGEVRNLYGEGWSKHYRDISGSALYEELTDYMVGFGMLETDETGREITILPLAGKIAGNYPKDYWEKRKDNMHGKLENQ